MLAMNINRQQRKLKRELTDEERESLNRKLTILAAALSTIIGLLCLNKLPLPYHPVFNTPNFERASEDGFFLCIEFLLLLPEQ